MPSGSGKADPLPGSARERRPVVDFLKMRSVQGKFLVYVVPLVLISTIVVFGLFEWTARKSAEQQLQVKLEKMIDIQSAVVAESRRIVGRMKIIRLVFTFSVFRARNRLPTSGILPAFSTPTVRLSAGGDT